MLEKLKCPRLVDASKLCSNTLVEFAAALGTCKVARAVPGGHHGRRTTSSMLFLGNQYPLENWHVVGWRSWFRGRNLHNLHSRFSSRFFVCLYTPYEQFTDEGTVSANKNHGSAVPHLWPLHLCLAPGRDPRCPNKHVTIFEMASELNQFPSYYCPHQTWFNSPNLGSSDPFTYLRRVWCCEILCPMVYAQDRISINRKKNSNLQNKFLKCLARFGK